MLTPAVMMRASGVGVAPLIGIAESVMVVVSQNYKQRWTDQRLKSHLFYGKPCSPSRAFRRVYGISVYDFVSTLRIREAVTLLGDNKVEWVAEHVGYRSKKNFYRAFRSLTGLAPTAVRPARLGTLRRFSPDSM